MASAPSGLSSLSTIAALEGADTLAGSEDPQATKKGADTPIFDTRARYEDVELLGAGGMGEVRRVRDRDLMRDLAVKRLRGELLRDRHQLQQFLWEARVTAYLDHPNIVPLHDLGLADDGAPYFSMKYVRGRSLRAFIDGLRTRDEACPNSCRRLRLFLQLCHAIEFAHAHGVLHRDLKPENVMLGEHGELLVMDWGIALPLPGHADDVLSPLAADVAAATTPSISGTPMYMSPEQASGTELDERSDVYTLGVILYELMALRRPFEGETLPELLMQVIEGDAKPLSEVAPDIAPPTIAVVERAMHVDPRQRYATVADLRRDVEELIDGGTPTAEQASIARRVGRFYMRQRNPWMESMRGIDFELMMTASLTFGLGVGALLIGPQAASWIVGISAVLMLAGAVGWYRNHRHSREHR